MKSSPDSVLQFYKFCLFWQPTAKPHTLKVAVSQWLKHPERKNGIGRRNTTYLMLVALLLNYVAISQRTLQVLKANSVDALITEGKDSYINWTISPGVRPDVYTVIKSPTPLQISLKTDLDFITKKLRPGQSFDFVVLLKGKDSCFTRFESLPLKNDAALRPELHDTIPFVLTEFNNIKLKVRFGIQDTLLLKFDSGSTGFLLTRNVIKNRLHLSSLSGQSFGLGTMRWDNVRVHPVEVSAHGTDGRFGWDVFDGKIVEIDYDRRLFIVHSRLSKIDKNYQRLEMEYVQGLFCISGQLSEKNKKYKSRFMFDTGYQRTIVLDTALVRLQNYPAANAEVLLKTTLLDGQGQAVPVTTIRNEGLILGKSVLFNIPVQLLANDNPAGFQTHILGNEVLKRFNTILDFQNNRVYLKPNSLFNLPYAELSKG